MKQENYIKGMIMIILSAFFFACMNVSVRLAGNLPSVEKSFFRNLVAAVFAAVILCKDHTLPKVNKKYWGPLILRCVCGTMGILCNFYAIDHLLVADASILNKLSPFFAIIFSFLLLKEKRLNHKFCGISDSSRSSVGSYRIASERNIRHQDIRIPVCEES